MNKVLKFLSYQYDLHLQLCIRFEVEFFSKPHL